MNINNPPFDATPFLAEQYRRGAAANFGVWYPPEGISYPFGVRVGHRGLAHILEADQKKDTVLYPALFKAWPHWRHGLQGTGDCESWAWEHMLDCWIATSGSGRHRTVSEAVYGFGRVEIYDRPDYSGPGMNSAEALKGTRRFGTLHELEYDDQGYDLRQYSGTRAIQWGRTGVPDVLEPIAAKHKVQDAAVVTDPVMAGALIQAGYAWSYSGYTYWGRLRDDDGVAISFSGGWHAMTCTGVRYRNGQPWLFLIANTGHGNHVKGPVGPIPMPEAYAQCASWIPVQRIAPVLQVGDCHAVTLYEDWRIFDWQLDDWL